MKRPVHSRSSRGVALVVAIGCLVAVSMYLGATGRLAMLRRAAARTEADRAQAVWLAESGLARAAARLAQEPGYTGEVWSVSADELGAAHGGRVEIVVEPAGDGPSRAVRATADYPDDPAQRVRIQRAILVQP